jgi:hypothetical protein
VLSTRSRARRSSRMAGLRDQARKSSSQRTQRCGASKGIFSYNRILATTSVRRARPHGVGRCMFPARRFGGVRPTNSCARASELGSLARSPVERTNSGRAPDGGAAPARCPPPAQRFRDVPLANVPRGGNACNACWPGLDRACQAGAARAVFRAGRYSKLLLTDCDGDHARGALMPPPSDCLPAICDASRSLAALERPGAASFFATALGQDTAQEDDA